MLDALGIEWFSTGISLDTDNCIGSGHLSIRPKLTSELTMEYKDEFLSINPNYFKFFSGLSCPSTKLSKEFVNKFDIILSCNPRVLLDSWSLLRHKPVVLVTCGNTHSMELKLTPLVTEGLKIVRGSRSEFTINNCNQGFLIPCFVDDRIYRNWEGTESSILSFQSHFKERRNTLPVQSYLKATKGLDTKVFGAYAKGNKDPLVIGTLTYEEQVKAYRKCGLYFCISNGVAPVTFNFLEALVMGVPVVCFGPKIGGSTMVDISLKSIYNQHNLIENGVDGFYSDNVEELKDYSKLLLSDKKLAREIGKSGRDRGIGTFGKNTVVNQWRDFINGL